MKFDPNTLNYLLEHTTIENNLLCTTEECAELSQCCTKWLRGRNMDRAHLREEMSDVMVNLYLLAARLDIDMCEINQIGEVKLQRFKHRLEEGEKP